MSQIGSFISAAVGGALIGVSATIMLLGVGRVAGISGILGGALIPGPPATGEDGDRSWRWAFLAGLLLGGLALRLLAPATVSAISPAPLSLVVVAGLLVGVGTQLGNGCTSGHGVCGMSRLAPRSMAATITFMLTGAIAALATRQLFGVGA